MARSKLTREQRRERTADIVARRMRGEKWREIGDVWGLKPNAACEIARQAASPKKPHVPRFLKPSIDENCQVPGLFHLMYERRIRGDALARTLDLDGSAVSCWRHGKSAPTLSMLKRLAEHLDVSLDVLVYWRGEGS